MKHTLKKITLSTALATALFINVPTESRAFSIFGTSIDEATLPMQIIQNESLIKETIQTAEQIQQYYTMLESIGQLPQQQWDQFQNLFLQLKNSVDFRTAINPHATDYKSKFQNLFLGYDKYLETAKGDNAYETFQAKYQQLRTSMQDNVRGSLEKLNFSIKDMEDDEATMRKLQLLSSTAVGQKAAIQVANEIAMHQTHALKKLHNTMATFASMEAQNLSTQSDEKIINQAGRDAFMLNRVVVDHNDNVPIP